MKRLKKISFIVIFLALALAANAQIRWGIKAGLNASNIRGLETETIFNESSSSMDYKAGFHAGIMAQFMFTEKMGIESGLYYSMLGAKKNQSLSGVENGTNVSIEIKQSLNPSYIQLPVLFLYKFTVGSDLYLYPTAGVYLGYGVAGKYKSELTSNITDENLNIDTDFFDEDNGTDPFDMGASVGLNLQYSKVIFGIGYDYGFLKINTGSGFSKDLFNNNAKVSVAYLF